MPSKTNVHFGLSVLYTLQIRMNGNSSVTIPKFRVIVKQEATVLEPEAAVRIAGDY